MAVLHHSEETKRKISESKKGCLSPMKGKKHSEESKRKNRIAHLGKSTWNKGTGNKNYKRTRRNINKVTMNLSHINFLKNNEFGMWFIPKDWLVHHIDLNPQNNDPPNLVCIPNGIHTSLHNQIAKLRLSGGT